LPTTRQWKRKLGATIEIEFCLKPSLAKQEILGEGTQAFKPKTREKQGVAAHFIPSFSMLPG